MFEKLQTVMAAYMKVQSWKIDSRFRKYSNGAVISLAEQWAEHFKSAVIFTIYIYYIVAF